MDEPEDMLTPEERLERVAEILARGVMRLIEDNGQIGQAEDPSPQVSEMED